jgi:purine-binding chemotaxis protein CheW
MVNEFLSFELADELYAVPIGKVRELLGGVMRPTRIPNAPAFLKGIVNLRGTLLPIVDLREEFGLPAAPFGKYTVVIVTEVGGVPIGVVVDRAVDVVTFGPEEIRPQPARLDAHVQTEFIKGLAQVSERLVVILDMDSILTDEQMGILKSAGSA